MISPLSFTTSDKTRTATWRDCLLHVTNHFNKYPSLRKCLISSYDTHLPLPLKVGELVHEQTLVAEFTGLDELKQVEQLVHLSIQQQTVLVCLPVTVNRDT